MDSDPNAVNPGGVPIFRGGVVVGGIGVAGVSADVAEYAAFAAATSNGFGPTPAPPGVVYLGGIALPFVNQTTRPDRRESRNVCGAAFLVGPVASAGQPPEGDLVAPAAGPLGGLSADGRAADIEQRGSNCESNARGDSFAAGLNDANGDCRCGSGRHGDWFAAHGGCHGLQYRRGGDQGAQHGVLQRQRAHNRGSESSTPWVRR